MPQGKQCLLQELVHDDGRGIVLVFMIWTPCSGRQMKEGLAVVGFDMQGLEREDVGLETVL